LVRIVGRAQSHLKALGAVCPDRPGPRQGWSWGSEGSSKMIAIVQAKGPKIGAGCVPDQCAGGRGAALVRRSNPIHLRSHGTPTGLVENVGGARPCLDGRSGPKGAKGSISSLGFSSCRSTWLGSLFILLLERISAKDGSATQQGNPTKRQAVGREAISEGCTCHFQRKRSVYGKKKDDARYVIYARPVPRRTGAINVRDQSKTKRFSALD